MTAYLLDTNIFTAILRNESIVMTRVAETLAVNSEFLLCPVVFYEVYRGLLHRDARRQLSFFLSYITTFTHSDFASDDWQQAAQLWAELRGKGQQISDADLLIGAYALRRQAIIVTDNEKDFIPFGVTTENWRK
jgi:tRNA(fMet)-specific endonuclease VapC